MKNVFRDSSLWDGLFIEVHGGPLESKLIIGNIYRPPKYNNNNAIVENFVNEITPIIFSIAKSSCNIVISGDFNIDLLQINERVKYQKYFDMFVTNGLFPLITLPTREGKQSATLIDQIFCKVKNFTGIDSTGILKSSLSDHYPCLASLDICKKKQHKPKYVTIKVAEDDISFKLAIFKRWLHLNDNTGFCSIIQASKLVFGSLLAKNNFLSNFEQKILHPPGWPIVGASDNARIMLSSLFRYSLL